LVASVGLEPWCGTSQAVYTALKETETRATDLLPFWKLPFLKYFVPRFQKVDSAVTLIQQTTEELIAKCKQMVDAEEEAAFAAGGEEYINEADPSVLRFLIASGEEVTAQQLRDDLLSMLVAGHETTASVLTWTLYLLVLNPPQMAKVGGAPLPACPRSPMTRAETRVTCSWVFGVR
jgi:carotenoid epsilon hydroxylase